MRIKKLKIENYKTLKKVELDSLGDIVVFIGANMAGKSNVFDAISFLKEGSRLGLREAIERRGGYQELVWQKEAEETMRFEIVFELDRTLRERLICSFIDEKDERNKARIYGSAFLTEVSYSLVLKWHSTKKIYEESLTTAGVATPAQSISIIKRMSVGLSAQSVTMYNNLQDQFVNVLKGADFTNTPQERSSGGYDSTKLLFTDEGGRNPPPLEERIVTTFAFAVNSWRRLNPHISVQNYFTISDTTELSSDAQNLAAVAHKLGNNNVVQFEEIRTYLHRVIPTIARLSTPVNKGNSTIGLQEKDQPASTVYELANISAGTKNVLAIIMELVTCGKGGIVFIEEPEAHLHPQAIRSLMEVLRAYSSSRQIMITTHSPVALMGFSINSIILVRRNLGGDTRMQKLTPDDTNLIVDELGIRPSDILNHEVIAFVEGDYDMEVFGGFMAKVGIGKEDICFIPTDGWTNMQYHTNASILEKARVRPAVLAVFDGDTENRKDEKERMLSRMHVPKENIFTLGEKEVECYLLDIDSWFKTWPDLEKILRRDDLNKKFDEIRRDDKPKEKMEKLMIDLGIRSYTREIAVMLVENIAEIPKDIEKILKRVKMLVGEKGKSDTADEHKSRDA